MTTQRILIFTAYFYPHLGGYEKNIYELSRRLVERGYQIDVVTCNTEGASVEEKSDGICIHRLPSWSILGGTYPIPKPTATTFNILLELLTKKFDLMNTQTRFFLTSLLGLIFAKIKRTPLVHIERGTRHSVLSNKLIESLSKIYDHTIGSLIIKSAEKNIGVSKATCDFLEHLGARNTIIIPNGIDTNVFRKVETNLRERLELNDAIVITFVGRLIYAKGVQDLISAFPKIKEAIPNAKFLIVGDGPYKHHLEALTPGSNYNKDIKFLGQKNQDQVIEILSATDVFVNASYSEGLPTSVLEAGATGLAIVATDVGGTKEIIEDGNTGFLVPPHDAEALKEKICQLIKSRQLREDFGGNIHKFVKENFDWNEITDRWIREIISPR